MVDIRNEETEIMAPTYNRRETGIKGLAPEIKKMQEPPHSMEKSPYTKVIGSRALKEFKCVSNWESRRRELYQAQWWKDNLHIDQTSDHHRNCLRRPTRDSTTTMSPVTHVDQNKSKMDNTLQ